MSSKRKRKRPKLRLIKGGAVVRVAVPDAAPGLQPCERFREAVFAFVAGYMKYQQEWPAAQKITESDVLAVMMRVSTGLALALGVPPEEFVEGMTTVVEQEMDKLESTGAPDEPPPTG